MLKAIWTHAKDHAKREQEEKRKQREAKQEARAEYLRRFDFSSTGDDNLDRPLAA